MSISNEQIEKIMSGLDFYHLRQVEVLMDALGIISYGELLEVIAYTKKIKSVDEIYEYLKSKYNL